MSCQHTLFSAENYRLNCQICIKFSVEAFEIKCMYSDAASGWAGWALAHPEFGSSVNPISTRGADFAHHITACPPGFENLAASLSSNVVGII